MLCFNEIISLLLTGLDEKFDQNVNCSLALSPAVCLSISLTISLYQVKDCKLYNVFLNRLFFALRLMADPELTMLWKTLWTQRESKCLCRVLTCVCFPRMCFSNCTSWCRPIVCHLMRAFWCHLFMVLFIQALAASLSLSVPIRSTAFLIHKLTAYYRTVCLKI